MFYYNLVIKRLQNDYISLRRSVINVLRRFTIIDKPVRQYFASLFRAAEQKNGTHYYGEVIVEERNTSIVTLADNGKKVIKFIKPRSWEEYLKHLWFHCRVYKEIRGNRALAALGLRTPKIYEVGTSILPFPTKNFKYLGYHCMENLYEAGYEEAYNFYKKLDEADPVRAIITQNIIRDVLKMRKAHIVFSDLHLKNVFADGEGNIAWIDTGIIKCRSAEVPKFRTKYNRSIDRLLNFYRDERVLSETEKAQIREACHLTGDRDGPINRS